MRLRRPLLLTSLDPAGATALGRIDRDFGGTTGLALNAMSDPGANRLVEADDAAVRAAVTSLFEQSQFWEHDLAVWVAVGDVTTPAAGQILRERILPILHEQRQARRPLFFVLLAGDPTPGIPASASVLDAFARDVDAAGLVGTTQIHLLRTHGSSGFSIGSTRSLADYLAIATEAIILANDREGDEHLLVPLVQVPAIRTATPWQAGRAPIFGRLAVVRVKPLAEVATDTWAWTAIRDFSRSIVDSDYRIPPGWSAGMITLNPPDLAGSSTKVLSAVVKQGPPGWFPEPPALRADPYVEMARIGSGAHQWHGALDAWSREIRARFVSLVREHRDAAAREQERTRAEVTSLVRSLWADPASPAPHLHIREALTVQRRRWAQDSRGTIVGARPVRQASGVAVRAELQRRLDALATEVRSRPNVALMAIFGALTAIVAFIIVQQALDVLDLRWITGSLDIDAETKVWLWRIAGTLAVAILVLGPLLFSIVRTRSRWRRAYKSVSDLRIETDRQAMRDVEAELSLVSSHWAGKIYAAALAHIDRCERQLNDLLRVLYVESMQPDAELKPASALERLVPDRPEVRRVLEEQAAGLIRSVLDPRESPLRTQASATAWLNEPRTWPRRHHRAIREAIAEQLRTPAILGELESTFGGMEAAVGEIADAWPRIGDNLLAHDTSGVPHPATAEATFVSGFGHVDPGAIRFGPRIDVADRGDQVLALRAQTGLSLDEAVA